MARNRRWSGSCGNSTEVRGALRKLEAIEDVANLLKAPVGCECKDTAKSRHLSARYRITRMVGQAGIEHLIDNWVARQVLGHGHRVGIAALHAKRQGLQPAEDRVSGFRMQNPAGYLSIGERFSR